MTSHHHKEHVEEQRPPLPKRDLSPEQLQVELDKKTKIWHESTCRKMFLDIIDRVKPSAGWHFDKVVCLVTGAFASTPPEWLEISLYQLACVLDTAKALVQRGHAADDGVKVVAQDMVYTPQDSAFLGTLGVEVLKTEWITGLQKAKDHLGPLTLLFEWHIEYGDRVCSDLYESEIGLRVCSGSGFMRSGPVQELDGTPRIPDFFVHLADRFDAMHGACEFPPFCEDGLGNPFKTVIHWPKRREDEKELRDFDQI